MSRSLERRIRFRSSIHIHVRAIRLDNRRLSIYAAHSSVTSSSRGTFGGLSLSSESLICREVGEESERESAYRPARDVRVVRAARAPCLAATPAWPRNMAKTRGGRAYGVVHSCLYVLLAGIIAFAQDHISPGSRYYNRDGVYVPPEATGYKTYVYKDRRYGYQPSYLEPGYRGPTRAPEDRFLYGVSENHSCCCNHISMQQLQHLGFLWKYILLVLA